MLKVLGLNLNFVQRVFKQNLPTGFELGPQRLHCQNSKILQKPISKGLPAATDSARC